MPDLSTERQSGYLVNGRWISSGQPLEIRSPFDRHVVGVITLAAPAIIEDAVAGVVEAFELTKSLPSFERSRILHNVAREVQERKEEFARIIALEAGKPIKTARGEVDRAIFTFTVAAEEAGRISGEFLPLDLQEFTKGRWGIVRRFPVGPILAITPFNFPLNLVAHKVAPAIAAGCPVVLKPSLQTPLTALLLAKVIENAGWPAGALSVLPLHDEDAAPLLSDDRLKVLSFTGSSRAGWYLKSRAGKKRVLLELGGNAGVIIHSDADVEYAAERCATVGFAYSGQSCISVQRIFVHREVYEKFGETFVARAKQLKSGDPLDETTDIGPLIRESDADRAMERVKEAAEAGAKILSGGGRNGSVLEPTILTNTTAAMRVNCEEIFAPVKTVEPYDTPDEAIRRINGSSFGLQAGLFTNDAKFLFRAYEELEVGGLIVGDVPTFRIDHMPYGGTKDSGMGREGVRYAVEEFTEPKLLAMNLR